MGKDFEIVAYRGEALSTPELAALIAEWTPYADFFRHSVATERSNSDVPPLNWIAFYESVGGLDEDEAEADGPAAPSERAPKNAASYVSESQVASLTEQLKGGNASLSDVVQAAWKVVRASAAAFPVADSDCPGLVRTLSRLRGDAFLLGYADHSCIGIYGRFRDGSLVDPQTPEEIHAEHDDYGAWPSRKLSEALGTAVNLDAVAMRCFPDEGEPPLHAPGKPERAIPFDADHFAMGLSESM